MKRIRNKSRLILLQLFVIATLLPFFARANKPFVSYSITGQTCIAPGTVYSYAMSPIGSSGYMTWTIQGGSFTGVSSGSNLYSVSVTWNSGNITRMIFLQFVDANNITWNASLPVSLAPALTGGTISSNASQSINYNATPSAIGCTLPTGGDLQPQLFISVAVVK